MNYTKAMKKETVITKKQSEIDAYNEAREICRRYVDYKGDKRKTGYKYLAHIVQSLYMARMNNFGKKYALPLFESLYL